MNVSAMYDKSKLNMENNLPIKRLLMENTLILSIWNLSLFEQKQTFHKLGIMGQTNIFLISQGLDQC